MSHTPIPGYTYGDPSVPRSPFSLAEFELLKRTALFDDDDVRYLRLAGTVLADQVEAILDVWYGFVASQPHLLRFFSRASDGQPNAAYLEAVRKRFGQWILDTCNRPYDQAWLDYQYEIGRRHHRAAKNRTDGADAVDHINFRYLFPLVYPITATLKPFLARHGHGPEEVERMHHAWLKSVILQVTLWSQPYVREGDF